MQKLIKWIFTHVPNAHMAQSRNRTLKCKNNGHISQWRQRFWKSSCLINSNNLSRSRNAFSVFELLTKPKHFHGVYWNWGMKKHGPSRKTFFQMRCQLFAVNRDWSRDKMAPHFADDIFQCIFINEEVSVSNKISLKFVFNDPSNMTVQVMASDKSLSEPMLV